MEPVFMILGQSAATAAVMAIDSKQTVQYVPYAKLREQLLKDGQVLEYLPSISAPKVGKDFIDPKQLGGIVVDDDDAKLAGDWTNSSAASTYVGNGYRHDGKVNDGKAVARFEATLPKAGKYEVRLAYPPNANRSSKVQVEVHGGGAPKVLEIDQRKAPPIDGRFLSLGEFEFDKDALAVVIVSNAKSDGYVVIDAVQWLAK
jgi:hypothetical protein